MARLVHVRRVLENMSSRRRLLKRAARQYAGHGWSVTPGAWLAGGRFTCGPGCPTVACHPALSHWSEAASVDGHLIAAWWRLAPYSLLLPTGRAFDVLDLPAHLGLVAAAAMLPGPGLAGVVRTRNGPRGPVAVTPAGRWMLFVQPGDRLIPKLAEQPDVVLHGKGSWIPAPPTRMADGRVRWQLSPEAAGWQLPDAHAIQDALLAALPALPSVPRRNETVRVR